MSVLARNKRYILPYCQGIYLCVEVKYFARDSLTAMSLTLPCIPTVCTLSRRYSHKFLLNRNTFIYSVHKCVERKKL